MFSGMKYVVIDSNGFEQIFLFPNNIKHNEFLINYGVQFNEVVSAGFVHHDALNPPTCCGHSISLGKTSRPEDTDLLRREFGWDRGDIKEHSTVKS